jgi:hypothetical protein
VLLLVRKFFIAYETTTSPLGSPTRNATKWISIEGALLAPPLKAEFEGAWRSSERGMRSATVGCVILLQRRPKKLGRQRKKISLLSRLGGMANNYRRSWWWSFERRRKEQNLSLEIMELWFFCVGVINIKEKKL